jgi:hypothetical protein
LWFRLFSVEKYKEEKFAMKVGKCVILWDIVEKMG